MNKERRDYNMSPESTTPGATDDVLNQAAEKISGMRDQSKRTEDLINRAVVLASQDRIDAALEDINQIRGQGKKARAMAEVALTVGSKGNMTMAEKLLEQVNASGCREYLRERVLRELAVSHARLGDIDSALKLIGRIAVSWQQEEAKKLITEVAIEQKLFVRAKDITQTLPESLGQGLYRKIAKAEAEDGQFEQARNTADKIKDTRFRTQSYLDIIELMAAVGEDYSALWKFIDQEVQVAEQRYEEEQKDSNALGSDSSARYALAAWIGSNVERMAILKARKGQFNDAEDLIKLIPEYEYPMIRKRTSEAIQTLKMKGVE